VSTSHCPFCDVQADKIFYEGSLTIGIWDGFPVSNGHALIITRRHVPSWFDATPQERIEITETIEKARTLIASLHAPSGFNIGINVGEVAGQTIFHLHAHVIPRYKGDVDDPRGGVRHVIPRKGKYVGPHQRSEAGTIRQERTIVTGGDDPLLPHLLSNFTKAIGLDIAVAFTMQSGVKLLQPYLAELLERGGKVRFLTGDYLGVTEPDALTLVLDLDGNITRRIFETGKSLSSFHPKTYIFHYKDDYGIAFVGSSNLSKTALRGGVEWDYRVVSSRDPSGFQDIAEAFNDLFVHPAAQNLTYEWIESYRPRHRAPNVGNVGMLEVPIEDPVPPITPHPIQKDALAALERTRLVGNTAGLVVLATGLGKTWLSAFDSQRKEFKRVLFVAHREEILSQALETFRHIRPGARLGTYDGNNRDIDSEVLFASIQTLGKKAHLERFLPSAFDYIIVDEFHHGSAPTYMRLIDYFEPKFLLGLTATPERTDGGDLLALCQENLVYRCDLGHGIREGLLCPFHYFGVPDIVDYRNIPWRRNRFDEEKLTIAVATRARADNALEQYWKRSGKRTLAFCVSKRHADFMADHFRSAGIKAAAVHSGDSSSPRAASLDQLRDGELDVIFAVDMFNEGIDIPSLDTVLMLRPTESKIVWLQQFGRGLRTSTGKTHLNVIDYIGNHRTFLLKPLTLLEELMPFKPTDREIWNALQMVQTGGVELPPGCEVTYELESIEILRALLKLTSKPEQAIQEYYRDFKERTGQRPTAVEAYHDGFSPKFVRSTNGTWLKFVESMGDLTPGQRTALSSCGEFLENLETTQMTRSYKMLLLKALLKTDRLPGQSSLSELTQEFSKLVASSSRLRSDLSRVSPENLSSVKVLLKKDPIAAWTGAKDKTGKPYFQFTEEVFRTTFSVSAAERESLRELTRELVDWRLAEYLGPEEISEDAQPADVTSSITVSTTLELWQPYQRKEIAPIFGWKFSTGNWNGGFVTKDKHIFLLVTLDKETKTPNFQYQDHFLSPDTFQWQSQNQTKQSGKTGNEIRNHASLGFTVHLFVRKASKTPNGTGAPFHYCGEVDFTDWENERPITVRWRLKNSLPERLQTAFRFRETK
jgi:superfamily II DNA or RNA helicase/HKD family nuclease/diadenosine tetraphosphate (Ap4A) HIT family hydrolase